MKCEEVNLLMEEFYDGEADLYLSSGVEKHFADCSLCRADFERIVALDGLLEKSSAPPPPSAMLDRKIMQAFERQNENVSTSPAWWQRIFIGSLSVPKPALAAALVVFAIAVTAANLIGRYYAPPSEFSANLNVPTPAVTVPVPPEIIERTKIVEVPVIEERLVTRVVYVERKSRHGIRAEEPSAAQKENNKDEQNQIAKQGDFNLAMNGAVDENGYVTRANLLGFQPSAELKTRIIKQEKTNEK